MKRKFFSSLLMMVFAVASVGMFVSCKDYDDDIQKVNSDVQSLTGDLQDVKADLEQQLTDATSAYDTQLSQINDALKDNDADKEALNDKIAEITTDYLAKISALQAQIELAQEAINAAQADRIQEALEGYAALTGDVEKFKEDVEGRVGTVEKSIATQQAAIDAFKQAVADAGYTDVPGLLEAINTAESTLADVSSKLGTINGDVDELEELMAQANEDVDAINAQLVTLRAYIDSILRGLVFAPDFYYGGIEAMEAPVVYYTPVILANNSTEENPTADGETCGLSDKGETYLTPSVVAYYHMNPSYYDVKKINKIGVVSDDKDYVAVGGTRAAASAPAVQKFAKADNGLLAVTLDLDGDKISTSADEVSVLAIQAYVQADGATEDSIVTSDYAAVAQSKITDIVIANNEIADDPRGMCSLGTTLDTRKFHVYTWAKLAIQDMDHVLPLIYNSEEGIDLMDVVAAHAKRNAHTAAQVNETVLEDVSKYGLKWKFDLSHFTSGSNKTSESLHARLNGSVITACSVDANGDRKEGVADRSALGRTPMVRVTLCDTTKADEPIVAVGFIKFQIVEDYEKADKVIVFDNPDGTDLDCDGYSRKLTWAEIEDKVLSELNMSKAEFEANYKVELLSGDFCKLYQRNSEGRVYASDDWGTIEQHVDVEHFETSTLEWKLTAAEMYGEVWDDEAYAYLTDETMETGVRFISQNPATSDVYVFFNTGTIHTPKATWADANKIKEYWAAENGALGSGYQEIHNNVEVYGQNNADDEFINDIYNTLVNNKLALDITGVDPEGSFANDNLTFDFQFATNDETNYPTLVGQSGKEYHMTVSTDGKTLLAYVNSMVDAEPIATINGSVITYFGKYDVDTYVRRYLGHDYLVEDYAYDILNAVSHDELAKTASATIVVYAENGCGMKLPIDNYKFDVKFLRPIDAVGAEGVTFTDAIDGGNKVDMYDLVNFEDWRDVKWITSYIGYYGIVAIEPVTSEITTTLNGGTLGTTKLSDVTSMLKFTHVTNDPSWNKTHGGVNFGYLYYENNGQVVDQFQIRVPLKITYHWGQITTVTTDITVQKTIANQPARR